MPHQKKESEVPATPTISDSRKSGNPENSQEKAEKKCDHHRLHHEQLYNGIVGACRSCSCREFQKNDKSELRSSYCNSPQPESEGVEIGNDVKRLLENYRNDAVLSIKNFRKRFKKDEDLEVLIDALLFAQAKQIRMEERNRAAEILGKGVKEVNDDRSIGDPKIAFIALCNRMWEAQSKILNQ